MGATIVVGVDGTDPSRAALCWGSRQAAATNSHLRLVNVAVQARQDSRMLKHRLVDARRLSSAKQHTSAPWRPGSWWSTQCLRAILIQSTSSSPHRRTVTSSRSECTQNRLHSRSGVRLTQSAIDCRGALPGGNLPQRARRDGLGVVVGVGESDAAHSAIRFATAEARRRGQPLTLLRACDATDLPEDPGDDQWERDNGFEEHAKAVLCNATRIARSVHPDIDVRTRSVLREAAEALLDASGNADLLVIGSSRREGSARGLGPVSHDVLINLVGPTVIVHGGDPRGSA